MPADYATYVHGARDSDGDEASRPPPPGPHSEVDDVAGGGVDVRDRVGRSVVEFLVQGELRAEVVELLRLK